MDLQYLVAPALEQLQFFGRALRFLGETSDIELGDCVRKYHSFLLKSCLDSDSKSVANCPSFEVEVVWRAHLLAPVSYAHDCMHLSLGGKNQELLLLDPPT